ncbi:MAG TPA: ABC transporter ATP-binding protein, partial [Thermoanaerobaculia bacterium]
MSSERWSADAPAIEARSLGKVYRLGRRVERYQTLRDALVRVANSRVRFGRRRPAAEDSANSVWALRDVTFRIAAGEVVGVIGRNGAGKSTLLKILSRITNPSAGEADIRGRVGSLLEVGTGFHQELTGRENIFLNGAILGMRRAEIQRQFSQIVEFAEVEKFIDTPVKHYSSGMYLRLAFAVAAHMETEILLVDEVLAVGDAAFQKKCLGKMGEAAAQGRTVLFVSHNMSAVSGLCERALWIDEGKVAADGDVDDVTRAYLATLASGTFQHHSKDWDFAVESVTLRGADGAPRAAYRAGEELCIDVRYSARQPLESPYFLLVVHSLHGKCFAANMVLDGHRPDAVAGSGNLQCRFRSLPLLPGPYTVQMSIRSANGRDAILDLQDVASFTVEGSAEDYGFSGDRFYGVASRSIPVVVPYQWTLPDGRIVEVGERVAG